ncbi:MAG: hypothetical protein WC055_01385 [Melioribacteraceae bacterium]
MNRSPQHIFKQLVTIILFLVAPNCFAGDTLKVAGIEGLSFQLASSDYQVTITNSFNLHKMKIQPKGLSLHYKNSDKSFELFGIAKMIFEEDTLSIILGSASFPGLRISHGVIDTINISIDGSFSIKKLSMKPNGLTFVYDKAKSQYKIYGGVEFDIDKDTIKAELGNATNPGIEIIDGNIDHINASISSHFELKKLTIETDSLGVEWQKAEDENVFHFFGKVKIDIDTNKIAFDFGNSSHPGLILKNGKIDYLKISTTDDIHFAGFEVGTKDLTIEYSKSLYHLYGKIFLKKMWSAEIDLGSSADSSGVTLDLTVKPAKLTISHSSFELADIDLGPITLKDLKISLDQNKVSEADLKVDLPPGWEIAAKMKFKFVNHVLDIDAIDISWEALKIEEAIEIPGTGAFVTKLEGGLFGIEDPHEFTVVGDIAIAFGGPFNISGIGEVSLLYLESGITLSRSELKINADAKLGAYKKDGDWIPVLGDGHITLDLKWGQYYSIYGNLNIPSNPWTILKADLEAQLSQSGAFNAHIGVSLQIPKKIPLVGGHTFAQADGVIHYDKFDPSSYAAGWAKVNLGFFTWFGGVKYNFASKNYSTLGAKQIIEASKISSTVESSHSTSGPGFLQEHIKIVIDDSPNYVKIKLKFKPRSTRNGFYTEVDGPLGIGKFNLAPIYFVSSIDKITQAGMDITTIPTYQMQMFYNVDSLTFYIMAPGYKENQKATLPNAEYTACVNHFGVNQMIDSFEVHKMYVSPFVSWAKLSLSINPFTEGPLLNILSNINLNYSVASQVYNNDSTVVNLFYTKHKNENGKLIKTVKYSDYFVSNTSDGEYLQIENINFPDDIVSGDSLYLYFSLDDRINAPYKSSPQYINYTTPISAKLSIAGQPDSLASGIETQLYIQNPSDRNWYLADSLKRFTNYKGEVSFPYCVRANTIIKLVFDVPVGYEEDPASPYISGGEILISDNNSSCEINEEIILRKINTYGVSYVR